MSKLEMIENTHTISVGVRTPKHGTITVVKPCEFYNTTRHECWRQTKYGQDKSSTVDKCKGWAVDTDMGNGYCGFIIE